MIPIARIALRTVTVLAFTAASASLLTADDQAREQFFEAKVRPLLVAQCNNCHGTDKQQGGVRLDLRTAVHKGEESGPLVVPGQPDQSRLIQVIRYSSDDVQMPPKEKLSDADIQILTDWVQQGAFWPEDVTPHQNLDGLPKLADGSIDFQAAVAQHWSFQPITSLPQAPTKAGTPNQNPIDLFLQQKLTDHGLKGSPSADRRTLIRRATFDLLGVPPTWEEVEAFVNDPDPNAWPKLVDRLLASPLYGQRWGRHWLDIARYADTRGYVFTQNHKYPFSYTYRDYVIESLNSDKPFDRFIVEQLAADKLDLPENDPALAAMGFITAGPRYLNREPDIIDDRIDVVTRGLMGLTVACARCHDHKYDPVPTADYYSLYGVFQSSMEPENLPLVGTIDESTTSYQTYKAELDKRRQAIEDYKTKARNELTARLRDQAGDYILATIKKGEAPGAADVAFAHGTPREKLLGIWQGWLSKRDRNKGSLFALAYDLAGTPADQFTPRLTALLAEGGETPAILPDLNPRLRAALLESPPPTFADLMRRYEALFTQIEQEWKDFQVEAADATGLPDPASEEIRQVLQGPDSITDLGQGDLANSRLFERDNQDEIKRLERQADEWVASSPGAPPRAMVLHDKPQPAEPVVFIRGDVNRRGDKVPRQPPRILTAGESQQFTNGSGRLELAHSIVSPENPLTARVLVNRVWGWHFGQGLVATQSDFGLRGETPTHPELLDWLAYTFMHEDGWSLKQLHRRIMLSAAYQQSGSWNAESAAIDPENFFYWRFPRRRLEFEPMRDAMLMVAGRLDTTIGGRPVDIEKAPFSNRRTVYGMIDRNNFSSLLRTFDYPNPDATSPGRPITTVPQQALFALNSPFLRDMAESVAYQVTETAKEAGGDHSTVVTALYRRVLSRDPSSEERQISVGFLDRHPDDLVLLAQSLLMTNEFLFVD